MILVLTGAAWMIADIVKFSIKQADNYRKWKASLPPEHRAYVEAAEVAAAAAASAATVRHQWEKIRRFHAESQAGLASGFAHGQQMYADQQAQQRQQATLHGLAQEIASAIGQRPTPDDSWLLHQSNRSDIFGNFLPR
ncbi:MAG TPA: hypothetical protein VNF75_01010 [Candidatus Dormibacteraeota bacterium]|nr:hypothetical protein [Candidatus Dormibacteraeota bacterium]